jgi:hypothetical protein
MDITFEMIEEVLNATDADYYTAKKALTDNDGDVQAAIKAIEETKAEATTENSDGQPEDVEAKTDETSSDEPDQKEKIPFRKRFSEEQAEQLADRLKEKVEAGNVDRIKISKKGKTLLDIPLNVGLIGGLVGIITVPWAMIIGLLVAYGTDCKIEIIKSDGTSEKL